MKQLALVVSAIGLAGWACAQSLSYGTATERIEAGVLIIESQRVGVAPGVPANVAPHVWGQLDQDSRVKPASWIFTNPLGQSTMGAASAQRWNATPGAGSVPAPGTPLTKRDAAYWEVPLASASSTVLSRYDILSLTVHGDLALNPIEREKLRRYVDEGGTLWIDLVGDATISIDSASPGPVPFGVIFNAQPVDANLRHPVLQSPNTMTLDDVRRSEYAAGNGLLTVAFGSLAPLDRILSWIAPESQRVEAVAGNPAGRAIAVAPIGAGYVVITSRGVTMTLNRGRDPSAPPGSGWLPNRTFRSADPVNDNAFTSAAKLAVNIVMLGSSFNSVGANSRATGGSRIAVEAPMLRRFTASPGGSFQPGKPAAIFKERMVVTIGNRIFVYDGVPSNDLSRDGNPDDGEPDGFGTSGDLIWASAPIGGVLSAPTVGEAPNSQINNPVTGRPVTHQIWVAGDNGALYLFDLDTPDGLNVAPVAPSPIAPPDASFPSPTPQAPTLHEGIVFVGDSRNADQLGRVWVVDQNTGDQITTTNPWSIRSSGRFPQPTSAPSVGYIPIRDNSSGLDRVVYMAGAPSAGGTPRPATLTSIWLGSKGESPVRVQLVGNQVRIATRASLQGLPIVISGSDSPIGVKISLLRPNGDPFSYTEMQSLFTGAIAQTGAPGEFQVQVVDPTAWDWDGTQTPGVGGDDVGWRIDYTIDWGRAGGAGGINPDAFVRGHLEFPDDANLARRIIGSPALGEDGSIYVVTGPQDPGITGGSLFALKEEGRGDFRMKYRYELFDDLVFNVNQGGGAADQISYPAAIVDEDPISVDIPFLNREITNMQFASGPAVIGGTVYVMARGQKSIFPGANSPTGILMAFRAEMPDLTFEVEGGTGFQLLQPDIARSAVKNQPTVFSVLPPNQISVESLPNSTRSKVTLNSSMNVTRGRIEHSIAANLPFIIRRAGGTDTVVEPEATSFNDRFAPGFANGRVSPLVWYSVANGFDPQSAPVPTGNHVFFSGASVLPHFLINFPGFPPMPPQFYGMVFAMRTDLNPADPAIQPNSGVPLGTYGRPWMQQKYGVIRQSAVPFNYSPSNAVVWPQFRGVESFDDFRIRLLQATLNGNAAFNLSAAEGKLAVMDSQRLYGFTRSDIMVVDEGRIGRFDPSGNPRWITTQTEAFGDQQPTGNAGTVRNLSNPKRFYPIGDNSYWVVEEGADRISRIDTAGRELRTITGFRVDPNFAPTGLSESASRDLRNPADVLVFETTVDQADNPFSNPQPLERWVHYLIADSGNSRAIEIVDRYGVDPGTGSITDVVPYVNDAGNTVRAYGVLLWHSPEELSGRRYTYNSIDRVTLEVGGVRRTVVALGFGNIEPGPATIGLDSTGQNVDRASGYGGVVLYDGANTIVINEFIRPDIPANAFLAETAPGSGEFDFLTPTAPQPQRMQKIAGLRSVTLRYVDVGGNPRLSVMLSEATGVYEIIQDLVDPDVWRTRWMLPVEAYVGMRRPRQAGPYTANQLRFNPRGFRAMHARRLDSGDVMIVNGYYGRDFINRAFSGEVVIVDGSFGGSGNAPGYDLNRPNFGFNALSVNFELPPVVGARGIVNPVFAERQ